MLLVGFYPPISPSHWRGISDTVFVRVRTPFVNPATGAITGMLAHDCTDWGDDRCRDYVVNWKNWLTWR